MFTLSKNSKKRRDGVDQRLIDIGDLAIKLTVVDFGYPADCGLRTADRQHEMYLDPSISTECDGYIERSYHQSGKALDFYAYVDGAASWKPEHLAMVALAHMQAASILGHKLQSGALWKSSNSSIYGWDMPHIQLAKD